MDRKQYFEELHIALTREGFTSQPKQGELLPVEWGGLPLCRITADGGVRYWQEDVATPERERACERATDLACTVREYMTLLEQAPPLQAQSLTDDYRLLADFNGAVLAAHPTRLGVQFVTWDWSFDHTGLNQGNYFQENYVGAKQDFAIRAGLISKQQIFNQEQLVEIYRCCSDTLDAGFDLTAEQKKCIRGVQEQIAMTRYFMRDTPLCQLEQQMMTPPNFKPRGHGRYSPGFQYSSEDTECPYCINFRRNQPCPLKLCICLDERIAACALNLNEFVRDCFFPEAGVQLLARLERNFTCCSISFFLNESHRERWQHWHARCYRMSGRNLAALFLLTAYEDIWSRMIWKFDARRFDFQSVQLSGIQPELYSVYQAVKAISTGSRNITLADLASPELVTDEAFHLIVCALLLAKYGETILNFEGK